MKTTKIVAAAVTVLALAACGAPTVTVKGTDPAAPTSSESAPSATQEAPAEAPAAPAMTTSQEQAVGAAESYLDLGGFSKAGLIGQLTSEYGDGFSKADAVFAVNYLKPDWNAEAVEAAKSYLEISNFSRKGLIDQLSSEYGDKFTKAQATYAAEQVGL